MQNRRQKVGSPTNRRRSGGLRATVVNCNGHIAFAVHGSRVSPRTACVLAIYPESLSKGSSNCLPIRFVRHIEVCAFLCQLLLEHLADMRVLVTVLDCVAALFDV